MTSKDPVASTASQDLVMDKFRELAKDNPHFALLIAATEWGQRVASSVSENDKDAARPSGPISDMGIYGYYATEEPDEQYYKDTEEAVKQIRARRGKHKENG